MSVILARYGGVCEFETTQKNGRVGGLHCRSTPSVPMFGTKMPRRCNFGFGCSHVGTTHDRVRLAPENADDAFVALHRAPRELECISADLQTSVGAMLLRIRSSRRVRIRACVSAPGTAERSFRLSQRSLKLCSRRALARRTLHAEFLVREEGRPPPTADRRRRQATTQPRAPFCAACATGECLHFDFGSCISTLADSLDSFSPSHC